MASALGDYRWSCRSVRQSLRCGEDVMIMNNALFLEIG